MIRGFQVSEEFIDGSVISGSSGYSMSIPTYNIDRIEVIKGPNAVLVPGGSPRWRDESHHEGSDVQERGFSDH